MKNASKDYYEILQIPVNSEASEIKKAFRKLALEYHPDKNPNDPSAEEKFKEISEAYGVLINPLKRKEYDRFRTSFGSGSHQEFRSGFNYSQRDIFEDLFNDPYARQIFEELNRQFNQSGFRSGPSFFESVLFGGAAGGLGRLLTMMPGPVGKIGVAIKLAQAVGSSLFVLNKVRQAQNAPRENGEPAKKPDSIFDNIKGWLSKVQSNEKINPPLQMDLKIAIPAVEALNGTKKKISYRIDDRVEEIMIRIPPNTKSGTKLRVKNKGFIKDENRGDLIITIDIKS